MAHLRAPRFVLGILLLAALACGLPALPNPSSIAGTAGAAAVNTAVASAGGGLETAAAVAASTAAVAIGSSLGPPPAFTPEPTPNYSPDTYLAARVKARTLKLDSATISGNGSDIYGPIISLQVTNPGTQQVLTTIPCGLVFVPDDNTLQRLMVLQAYSATVSAGGSATLTPYVACIDDSKHAPATGATYTIGNFATADLLKLATCVCTQPLTFKTDVGRELGLQVAIWHTADSQFPGNITSSPFGPAIQPFLKIGLATANGWLTSCGWPAIQIQ